MENALVAQGKTTTDDFKIKAEDIRKYFAPNATEKEFGILMGICQSFKLNPFKREVHFVKYGSAPASIITGYEIYLKRAERTGKLDGWKCWIEKDDIGEKAIIEIKRKDQSAPIHWEVYRKEFDKQQSTWKSMPTFMLKKVAIAQGFRLAFPDDLGGMPYIPEEMPHDKGGGTSEELPHSLTDKEGNTEIINAEIISPIPPVSTDAEKGDSLKPGSPLHKLIEAKINEAKIDRANFKEWLYGMGWLELVDEKPSFSTITDKHAKYLVDKWESATKTYNEWKAKQEA